PIEVLSLDNEAILRYFEKIEEEGEDHIYEAKLTLVGEGSSGKTSLQRRLLNEKAALPRKDKRTRGIKIKNWQFKKQRGTKHIVHIWDFGGQDVYYPVHRFFITENSVFVLLASTRQSHHNFDYWIPTIYQFGGKSPIILGQTCHEGNKIRWNDLGVYISNTNFNIIKTQILPYYEINLPNKNEGLKKIKQTIINQITNLKHYGKGVPKSWIPVRNVLEEERKKTSCISFEKFKEICKNSNLERFTKLTDITDCCRFLHDIGVVLWYSTIDELKNWVILQPEWAMNAVYKIIDDEEIQKRRGNILNRDFSRLWQESSYEDKHPILKKMLEIFKIAFPKRHKQEDYIIPARLLSMPIEKRWRDNEPYLRLEYYYEFMPRGMVNQMSAELSRYIASDNEVWNNAVNFIYENKIAECQVEEDFYNRKINIRAKGKDARGLIILIMEALKNITDGYKGVKPEINVPCTCYKCKNSSRPTSFLYDDLLRWSEKEVNAIAFCNEGRIGLSIRELLHNLGLSNPLNEKDSSLPESLKLFVSYSKHDEDYLQDFQDHLVTLKEQGLVTFDCRDIEFGKEWDEEIKRKIDECNIIVCLISVKFLNTEYIKKIEVQKAIDQNKIIVPIIIKACDWESSSLGRYQAAQKGRIVSLDNNQLLIGKIKGNSEEEKAAFWTAIIKEFRKKLF
ncbi:MAG TPA: COR domain-containing protein, partial [Bacteroidia bacterium]|nr:COR domain-containing protein [Bacteroidia bacterium]